MWTTRVSCRVSLRGLSLTIWFDLADRWHNANNSFTFVIIQMFNFRSLSIGLAWFRKLSCVIPRLKYYLRVTQAVRAACGHLTPKAWQIWVAFAYFGITSTAAVSSVTSIYNIWYAVTKKNSSATLSNQLLIYVFFANAARAYIRKDKVKKTRKKLSHFEHLIRLPRTYMKLA